MKKEGIYSQKLYKVNDTTKLVARNLQFEGGQGPPTGLVSVTMDGFPRAFEFRTPFSRSGKAENATKRPAIRIGPMQEFSPPKEKVVVPLEVDAPGNLENVNIRVELLVLAKEGKEGKEYDQRDVKLLHGARQLNIGLATADPKGALVFKTDVQDWRVELDTAGLFGEVRMRRRCSIRIAKRFQASNPPKWC